MSKEQLGWDDKPKRVPGKYLHRNLEKPIKVIKVRTGLHWRPQDVGNTRIKRHHQGEHTRNITSPWKMYVSGSTERMAEAAKPFDIRHIVTGFQSCFGPGFPMSPFLPFGMVMYIVCVTICNWKYIICFLKMKNNF